MRVVFAPDKFAGTLSAALGPHLSFVFAGTAAATVSRAASMSAVAAAIVGMERKKENSRAEARDIPAS